MLAKLASLDVAFVSVLFLLMKQHTDSKDLFECESSSRVLVKYMICLYTAVSQTADQHDNQTQPIVPIVHSYLCF